jgi:hypothetical protein
MASIDKGASLSGEIQESERICLRNQRALILTHVPSIGRDGERDRTPDRGHDVTNESLV